MLRLATLLLVLGSLLLTAAPSGARGDDGEWFIEDAAGDLEFVPPTTLIEAPQDVPEALREAPHADIVRVTAGGEDETGFGVDIRLAALTVADTWRGTTLCQQPSETVRDPLKFLVRFDMDDSHRFVVAAGVVGTRDPATGVFTASGGRACLWVEGGQTPSMSPQSAAMSVDDANDRIHLWIPKTSLMGESPAYMGPPVVRDAWLKRVEPGMELRNVQAIAIANPHAGAPFLSEFGNRLRDETPVAERPFKIERAPANVAIRVRAENGHEAVPVRADFNQSLAFEVMNLEPAKRIALLEYTLEGPADRLASYQVFGPARVTIPAGETRPLKLALKAGPQAQAEDNVTLSIRARSVGYPAEVGFDQVRLVPGPALGPQMNTLYILGGFNAWCSHVVTDAIYSALERPYCVDPFLSSNVNDPQRGPQTHLLLFPNSKESQFKTDLEVETRGIGTASGTYFDLAARVVLQLVLDPDQEFEQASLEGELRANNGSANIVLARFEKDVGRLTEGTTVTLDAPLRVKEPLLPRGTRFALDVALSVEEPRRLVSALQGGVKLRLAESFVRLPLLDLPPELRDEVTVSPFQLAALEDRENFVNPGKARLFNVTLVNQGQQTGNARLSVALDKEGWTAEVLPGHEFRLEPGDTVRLGLLASAPAMALEGDRVKVVLNATDESGRGSFLTFYVTAVNAIEFADDAGRYRVDSEAEAKEVRPEIGNTPGLSMTAVLAAAMALAAFRRRNI